MIERANVPKDENNSAIPISPQDAQSFILPPDQFASLNRGDDLEFILTHLENLDEHQISTDPLTLELEKFFILGMLAVEKRLPILQNATFPIHRRNRQMVRQSILNQSLLVYQI